MQSQPGETVADTSFGSVGCDHAMAGIVEQKIFQKMIFFPSAEGVVCPMFCELLLYGYSMRSVHPDVRSRHRVREKRPKTEKQNERFRHCSLRSRHYCFATRAP